MQGVFTDTEELWNQAKSANVITAETTTSTSYVQLTTTTDQVTVNVGPSGTVLLTLFCQSSNSTTGINLSAYDISGANTVAASDSTVLSFTTGTGEVGSGAAKLLTGLAPGSTTFKMYYRVNSGTGTFERRNIAAIPLY